MTCARNWHLLFHAEAENVAFPTTRSLSACYAASSWRARVNDLRRNFCSAVSTKFHRSQESEFRSQELRKLQNIFTPFLRRKSQISKLIQSIQAITEMPMPIGKAVGA